MLFYSEPIDATKSRRVPTDLEIRRSKTRHMERIFAITRHSPASDEIICIVLRNDSIDDAARREPAEPEFDASQYPAAEEKGYPFITAIFLHFVPGFGRLRTGTYQAGQYETFSLSVGKGVPCHIRIAGSLATDSAAGDGS
jgi:hypothetical protein